jgi:hypothetical protein
MSSSATSTVYPLAFPKGVKYLCELCQKPAHRVCEKCRVTYYWYFSILSWCYLDKILLITVKDSIGLTILPTVVWRLQIARSYGP